MFIMEMAPPVSTPDIALLRSQRALFELSLKYQQEERVQLEQQIAAQQEAERLEKQATHLSELLEGIPKEYQWLVDTKGEQRATLVGAFDMIHTFATQAETPKTSREVYIHFRKKIETDQAIPAHDTIAVQLLEALMKGDIRNGTLPF